MFHRFPFASANKKSEPKESAHANTSLLIKEGRGRKILLKHGTHASFPAYASALRHSFHLRLHRLEFALIFYLQPL